MPTTKRPCRWQGCPAIVEGRSGGGYCPEHRGMVQKQRDSQRTGQRHYNSVRWRKLRTLVLTGEPLCRECAAAGAVVQATVVDHILPLAQGGTDAMSNLQPLCATCHNRKTMRESVSSSGSGGRG